jgi:peptide/nickel transport system permease protein
MVLMGVFFCTSIVVVVFNLVTDMLYMIVDPRIRSAA